MQPVTIENHKEDLRPRCHVAFSIVDSPLDFEAISEALNQKSATIRKTGGRISQALPPMQEDVWIISSPLDPLRPLEEHLRWLREQLEPHVNCLADLSRTACLRVYIGFTLSQEQNGFRISAELIRFLASINVLIDMYILSRFGDDLTQEEIEQGGDR